MKRGQGSKNKGQASQPQGKPFCDCQCCECKNCPDILEKLVLSNKKSNCGIRPKVLPKGIKRKKSKDKRMALQPHRESILDSLNPDRNCDCEIMARAIRTHIHKNMGMTERRTRVKPSEHRPSNSKDID